MMTTNMEISRNFVNEHKSRQLASFLVLNWFQWFFNYLLDFIFTFVCFSVFFALLVDWNFRVSILVDMINGMNLITVLVKSNLLQLTLNIDNMDSSNVNNI